MWRFGFYFHIQPNIQLPLLRTDIHTLAISPSREYIQCILTPLPPPSPQVLNFWELTQKWSRWISDWYSSFKLLMVGHGESSAGSYLSNPTSTTPSHCAVIILFNIVPVHQLLWLALHELTACSVHDLYTIFKPLWVAHHWWSEHGARIKWPARLHNIQNPDIDLFKMFSRWILHIFRALIQSE